MTNLKTPLLAIKDVNKTFKTQEHNKKLDVLENISFDINRGEIVSIVGPSGCGKSTLLNMIAGFEKDYQGEILYENELIKEPSPDRGIVFQSPSLFSWLNVKNNIEFGLKIQKMDKELRGKHLTIFLKQMGLEQFEYYYPSQLSGGMQQRVALARVLIMNPKMILMDEPFSALDYQSRLEMQSFMLELWNIYKPTIVFVTHDIEESILIADRIIVMSKRPGRVVQEFKVLFNRPRHISLIKDARFNQMKIEILDLLT